MNQKPLLKTDNKKDNKEITVMFGNEVNYFIPSDDITHNLLLDTSAINAIKNDERIIPIMDMLKNNGYNFYVTDAQMREIKGISDRKGNESLINNWNIDKNQQLIKTIEKIGCKRVSCVALLLKNFTILDGSFRLIDEESITYPMFESIYNHSIHHIKDAVIAEATIYNNCILLTKDKR